jgi:hypothetical protein
MTLVAACAALVAATTATAQATGQLRVVGPWAGADEQSFRAVLDGFKAQNPGAEVTYIAAQGSVATAVTGGTEADVAVMALPADLDAMRTLARDGTLKQIEFAVPKVRSNYAFAWKSLGSVDASCTASSSRHPTSRAYAVRPEPEPGRGDHCQAGSRGSRHGDVTFPPALAHKRRQESLGGDDRLTGESPAACGAFSDVE